MIVNTIEICRHALPPLINKCKKKYLAWKLKKELANMKFNDPKDEAAKIWKNIAELNQNSHCVAIDEYEGIMDY